MAQSKFWKAKKNLRGVVRLIFFSLQIYTEWRRDGVAIVNVNKKYADDALKKG